MRRRVGRREENKAHKRSELERVGLELFISQGYAATSVEQIVAGADVARGTYYLYFHDKEALFKTLVERLAVQIFDALEECGEALEKAKDPATAIAAYEELRGQVVAAILAHPGVALLYFRELRTSGAVGDWVRSLRERIDAFVTEMLSAMMKRGLMRKANAEVAAHAIFGAIERVVFDGLTGVADLGTAEDLGRELLDLFSRGLLL
jgi:AcrR family transcriptional regulator